MMHLLMVGMEHKPSFVDSTLLRKSKFECSKCKLNFRDASIMCMLWFTSLNLLTRSQTHTISTTNENGVKKIMLKNYSFSILSF